MDVKTLYTLLAVADHGSFAQAANAIGLSVPAISMQMSALEEELGAAIFDRSRRPPVLTEEGLQLTHRARELIAHWESMSRALKKNSVSGLLKVGSIHTCASGILPHALKRLQQENRGIDIQLTTGLSHELERSVERRLLDAAIVTEPDFIGSELEFHAVMDEPFVVIAHRSIEIESDKQILQTAPYVRFNRSARVGRLIDNEIARRRIVVRSVMEIDNLEGVIAMVANGLGASIVPARFVKNDFPAAIQSIPFGTPPMRRTVGLLSLRGSPRARFLQVLLEALKNAAAASDSPAPRRGESNRVAKGSIRSSRTQSR